AGVRLGGCDVVRVRRLGGREGITDIKRLVAGALGHDLGIVEQPAVVDGDQQQEDQKWCQQGQFHGGNPSAPLPRSGCRGLGNPSKTHGKRSSPAGADAEPDLDEIQWMQAAWGAQRRTGKTGTVEGEGPSSSAAISAGQPPKVEQGRVTEAFLE